MMAIDLLPLAGESLRLDPGHVAANFALPIGLVLFCGSVFMLLWSNHGAKKGALIYGTAFFAFTTMLGVFWWFGAPGTPPQGGPVTFPGQSPDRYTAKWYPFSPESARAEMFDASSSVSLTDDFSAVSGFQPVAEYLGKSNEAPADLEKDPKFGSTNGDATTAGQGMVKLFLRDEGDQINLGGNRRAQYIEAGQSGLAGQVDDPSAYQQADPFFTASVKDGNVELGRSGGTLLGAADVQAFTNYVNADDATDTVMVLVDEQPMFAFKLESNQWIPSAVWTSVALVLFLLCLYGLDRVEQREKRDREEVEEPERQPVAAAP